MSQMTLALEQRHSVQESGNHSSSSSNSSPSKTHEPAPGVGEIAARTRNESVTFTTVSESRPNNEKKEEEKDDA